MGAVASAYQPRAPQESLLYAVVAEELETFLGVQRDREREIPPFIEIEIQPESAMLPAGDKREPI